MNTQLRAWCIGVLEAVCLAAVAAVPLFVNFYGFRVFDLGKAAILTALALVGALAALVAIVEGGVSGWRRAARHPLVVAAALLWVAWALAAAMSLVPRLSVFGSSERSQGLVFLTAVLVLFGAAAVAGRTAQRRARMVAMLVAGSVPVAVFALAQVFGAEVLPGQVESAQRVFGTLANPIFLGAYLMLVAPLALARLIEAAREGRTLLVVGTGAVLIVQLAALVATASRGPLIGLAAGAVVFALGWSASGGRRAAGVSALVVAVAGLSFLVALNLPGGPLEPLRDAPVIGRFAQIGQTATGSQATRLRIWSAVDRLLVAEPGRLATGHGPEALKYALLPYAGPNIAGRAQADRLADRSHNVLLDALVMTGVLGAVALLLFYGAWLFGALQALGLASARRDRLLLVGLLAVGTVAGALARLWPPLALYAAALALLGMVGGLVVFLLRAMWRRPGGAQMRPDPLRVALVAIAAAAVAEAAFGIQTVVTQVVLFVLAGLVVSLFPATDAGAASDAGVSGGPRRPRAEHASAPAAGTVTLTWSAGGAALGLIAGTAMSLVTYGFLLYQTQWLPATLPVAVVLIAATWLASLMAASDTHESATATALTALAVFACYAIVRLGVLAASGDPALLFAVTVVWLSGMALVAGWLLRETAGRAPVVAGATAIAHPILAVLAVACLFVLVVRPVQADIYFQSAAARFDQALQSDDPETFRAAEGLFARAVAANPTEDVYHLEWGERYTLVGSASGDAQTAGPWFQRAQTEVAAAERLDPLMPYHTFNRGHLQLVFAQMLPEEQRGPVAANAEIALQQAFDKLPSDPQVANELALAKLLKGDAAGATAAVALLEYVRDQLDAENPVTWQLLGRAYAAADRAEDATAALDRAMELGGGTPQDLLTLGDMARQRGDVATAIDYYERAIEQGPATWAAFFNLGLMYRDVGRTDDAMGALSRALQGAPAEEAPRVQAAIEDLLKTQTGATP